jgi:alpha-beta hydrolase superfamily lysophospholipase
MATAGYGVFGIDYEGHGKSMGVRCYIQKFDNLVTDCDRFFKSICGKTSLTFYFNRCQDLVMQHDLYIYFARLGSNLVWCLTFECVLKFLWISE